MHRAKKSAVASDGEQKVVMAVGQMVRHLVGGHLMTVEGVDKLL